jgi:hypothetical protein
MATRRGRPSKASRAQALQQDASRIAEVFLRHPLRQAIGRGFQPYFQRFVNGDLTAILDYCDSTVDQKLDAAFFELVGRLLLMQSPATKQIISEVVRRAPFIGAPPDEVVYQSFYDRLKPLCEVARGFINEKYRVAVELRLQQLQKYQDRHSQNSKAQTKAVRSERTNVQRAMAEEDISLNAERLWNDYVDKYYPLGSRSHKQNEISRSREIAEFMKWVEKLHARRRDRDSLFELVDRCMMLKLVPKPMFLDLCKTTQFPNRPDWDQRYRYRKMRWTPSVVARKYATAILGLSLSWGSHRRLLLKLDVGK